MWQREVNQHSVHASVHYTTTVRLKFTATALQEAAVALSNKKAANTGRRRCYLVFLREQIQPILDESRKQNLICGFL